MICLSIVARAPRPSPGGARRGKHSASTLSGGNRSAPKIVLDEYIRCFTRKTITGACRDYRAFATIDFEMDSADKDRQIGMPLLVLWGARGAPPTQEYPTVWRKYASNLVDAQPLSTGHYLQEEAPDQVYDHLVKFFTT